jgi:hypothetical protein
MACKPTHDGEHLRRVLRPSGARAHDQRIVAIEHFRLQPRVVVEHHVRSDAARREQVHDVVTEAVEIIDEEHPAKPRHAIPNTSRAMRVLSSTSAYSASGSESATIPAEACHHARPPRTCTLRNVMHESKSPPKDQRPMLPA